MTFSPRLDTPRYYKKNGRMSEKVCPFQALEELRTVKKRETDTCKEYQAQLARLTAHMEQAQQCVFTPLPPLFCCSPNTQEPFKSNGRKAGPRPAVRPINYMALG